MIKRIVEISESGRRLSVCYGQLIVKGQDGESSSIPCEDIGVLLVDHQGVSYTHSVFTELLRYGAAVVLCGANHHPAGMLLPLESNTLQSERFRADRSEGAGEEAVVEADSAGEDTSSGAGLGQGQ